MKIARLLSLTGLAVFLYTPIIVVLGSSFNGPRQMAFPPQDPSINWYANFFSDSSWTTSLLNSVIIAVTSSAFATVVALVTALLMWQREGKLHQSFVSAVSLPFLLPGIVFAVSISLVTASLGLLGSLVGIILGHTALLVAIPLVTVRLGLAQVEQIHVEAAKLMGYSDRQILTKLVIPIIRPYLVAGALFALIISMNEYIIAFMVSGFSVETLPIKIYNSQRYGFEPTLSVGTMVYMLFSLVVLSYIAATGKLWSLLGIKES